MALKNKKRRRTDRPRPRTIGGFFLRGVITLLPVFLTLVVFGLLFQMVGKYVTGPINGAIYWSLEGNEWGWGALEKLGIEPLNPDYIREDLLSADTREMVQTRGMSDTVVRNMIKEERALNFGFFRDLDTLAINSEMLRNDVAAVVNPAYGILLSLLLVLWLGWIVGSFVGRRFVQQLDRMMHVIPVVKSIYPYSKQLVEFFFTEKNVEFDTVVAIPYPSPGIWSIAFVTGNSLKTVREETKKDLISTFVPSSPMPMTGYTIFIERSRVIPLPITVDEALRITMTGGVLVPPHEMVSDAEGSLVFDPAEDAALDQKEQ
jgi:uncharacterized membrane protein